MHSTHAPRDLPDQGRRNSEQIQAARSDGQQGASLDADDWKLLIVRIGIRNQMKKLVRQTAIETSFLNTKSEERDMWSRLKKRLLARE